jgi:hypothetical protein
MFNRTNYELSEEIRECIQPLILCPQSAADHAETEKLLSGILEQLHHFVLPSFRD